MAKAIKMCCNINILIFKEMDDDVETDEDQLNAAKRHVLRELQEGIKSFKKNKRHVRNSILIASNSK